MSAHVIKPGPAVEPTEELEDEEHARLRQIERNRPAIELIESWIREGEAATDEERRIAEQEWEEFKRGIDEYRLSDRKLFA
jgi:hypothetical protein